MSSMEILAYIGIYAIIMMIGLSYFNKRIQDKPAQGESLLYPFANENREQPQLGTGLGRSNLPSNGFAQPSSHRKVS